VPPLFAETAIMTQAEHDRRIDYVEFTVGDMESAKEFYAKVFGWKFTDYGPDYTAFEDGRLTGGFHRRGVVGSPLVIIYAVDLAAVERSVTRRAARWSSATSFPAAAGFTFGIRRGTFWPCGPTGRR